MSEADKHRMALGTASVWSLWSPPEARTWASDHWYALTDRYWPKPYERFFDRIATRQRYKSGPHPWGPGRYRTSAWQPYSGFGRFSGLREIMAGKYYAGRYTGRHVSPDDYRHHDAGPITPEEIAREAAYRLKRHRAESWRFDTA